MSPKATSATFQLAGKSVLSQFSFSFGYVWMLHRCYGHMKSSSINFLTADEASWSNFLPWCSCGIWPIPPLVSEWNEGNVALLCLRRRDSQSPVIIRTAVHGKGTNCHCLCEAKWSSRPDITSGKPKKHGSVSGSNLASENPLYKCITLLGPLGPPAPSITSRRLDCINRTPQPRCATILGSSKDIQIKQARDVRKQFILGTHCHFCFFLNNP